MKKNKLYILCGYPASGKSTYAREYLVKDNDLYVSRDNIRFALLSEGDSYFDKEEAVLDTFYATINEGLVNTEIKNVIADATHLSLFSRRALFHNLQIPSDYEVVAVAFETELSECLRRNSVRTGLARVPEDVIRKMYKKYERPICEEGFDRVYTIK